LKRICFFNSCRSWGGGEKWHLDAATRLDRTAFEVVGGVYPGSELHRGLTRAGIPCGSFRIGNRSFLNPFKLVALVRWFRRQGIDTVVLNLPSDLKTAGVAARLAGVRRIVYRRGSAIPIRNTALNRWLFARILTEVIANSEETARTVTARNPRLIPRERITVLYNGIDLAQYDRRPAAPVYARRGEEVVLGTAGRLSYEKNQRFLIDVCGRLKQLGQPFKLLVAGTGPLEEDLKAHAAALGLGEQVLFLGFLDNIRDLMDSVDVFLLSSLWEGFGYVLIEAMAAGKPVVAFSNSSTPEICLDGETGWLVPLGDEPAFAERIVALARHPEMAARFGLAGRARVEATFSFEAQMESLETFLAR